MTTADPRLIQLSRMLGVPLEELEQRDLAQTIEDSVGTLAEAFFHEAADSDDVISIESGMEYLEVRLAYFGEFMRPAAAEAIRARFGDLIASWE
jgi:hypothetical protein